MQHNRKSQSLTQATQLLKNLQLHSHFKFPTYTKIALLAFIFFTKQILQQHYVNRLHIDTIHKIMFTNRPKN